MERTEAILTREDAFLSLEGDPLAIWVDWGIDGSLIPISVLYEFSDMSEEQAKRYSEEFKKLAKALDNYVTKEE